MTASPVCEATLLAPNFARLDDAHAPLCTPVLRALVGDHHGHFTQLMSPRIASPALAGWTPRLLGREEDGEDRTVASCGFRAVGLPSMAAEPLAGVPLPALVHGNFLPIPLPNNVRQYSGTKHAHDADISCEPTYPCDSRSPDKTPLHMLVKVEPATSAGSGEGSESDGVGDAPPPASTSNGSARRRHVATAAGLAAVVVVNSASTEAQPADCTPPSQHPEHRAAGRNSSAGARPASGGGSEPATMDDLLSDNRLTLESLEENGYFDMPIQQAAAELRVGVTTLKKVCRVNNIGRWPFRKRSSLNRLIEKTREYFAGDPEQCTEALAQLEAQRSVLRAQQGEDIPESVKRYRQSIFKLDYKVKKIARERRTHRGVAAASLAALDKAQTMKQLGVGTPASSILGILGEADGGCDPATASLEPQSHSHAAGSMCGEEMDEGEEVMMQ